MKFEVRRQRVKSQARRPIEFQEFENVLTIIRKDMDDRLCVVLNLVVYLELWGEIYTPENTFLFGQGTDGDKSVRNLL
jgi:hypothetical protein